MRRRIVGIQHRFAALSCGHLGDYAGGIQRIGTWGWCAVCAQPPEEMGTVTRDVRAGHGGLTSAHQGFEKPRDTAHVEKQPGTVTVP